MFCPKCGQRNDDAASFCVLCGQKIGTVIVGQQAVPVGNLPTECLAGKSYEVQAVQAIQQIQAPAVIPVSPPVQTPQGYAEMIDDSGIGRVLQGRYRLMKELGSGGMGKVFLAMDEKMESPVVVKEMLPYLIAPKERKYIEDHFKDEAKMLYRLKHMGLPRVTDFFFEAASIYIIMEYIDGEDLESIIKKRPKNRIEIEEFFVWITEVLKVLKYLHNQETPIIHRDIKPGNIMLGNKGEIVLVDFGVARTIAAKTGTQTRVGTPGFASPEHFFGKFILSSDIYSLGATFHYLISGDDPRSRNPFDYPPLDSYRDDIPQGLQKIVDKMLDPEPDTRYQRAEDAEQDFANLSKMLAAKGILKRSVGSETSFLPGDVASSDGSGTKLLKDVVSTGPVNWKKNTDVLFESPICAMSFSTDGKYLACGTGSNTIQIIDAISNQFLDTYAGHTDWVRAVSYSPDGKYVSSGSDDKFIKVWDTSTGSSLKDIYGHNDWVRGVKYSPCGGFIVSGSSDGKVKIWSTRSWNCSVSIDNLEDTVNCVDFSPTGKVIAAGSDDSKVYIWNSRNGSLVNTLEGHESYIYCIAFSPDGSLIASGSGDKSIKIWNVTTGACIRTLKGHEDSIYTLAFTPDGSRIASSGEDMKIRIWNVGTGRCENLMKGHTKPVYSIAFSPLGNMFVSGAGDKNLICWGF
jgi:WD40 repeat protein/tRNA A-37 threonylcarbamoyl transferase component Bud32